MMLTASRPKTLWKLVHAQLPLAVVSVILTYAALPAEGSFHFMQVEAIMGGVDGDTNAQAIELRMRAPGQNFLHSDAGGTHGPAVLKAWDANGLNPVTLIAFPSDVTNGAAGDTVLIASPGFSSHVSPSFSATQHADFTLTNLIPTSYLAAGRLTYEDNANDILWSLAWGGAGYNGPTTGSAPAFNTVDPGLNFGKFAGAPVGAVAGEIDRGDFDLRAFIDIEDGRDRVVGLGDLAKIHFRI